MPSRKGQIPTLNQDLVLHGEFPLLPQLESNVKSPHSFGQVYRARALPSEPITEARRVWHNHIDLVRARAFIYRFVAKALTFPKPKDWEWLSNPSIHTMFCSALRQLVPDETTSLRNLASQLLSHLHPGQFETFLNEHIAYFHSTEALPGFRGQPSGSSTSEEFSDIAGLLKSFGLEIAASPTKPFDLLCVELEFMSWLLTREAELLENRDETHASLYRRAQMQLFTGFLAPRTKQMSSPAGGLLLYVVLLVNAFVELQLQSPHHASAEVRHLSTVRVGKA